MARLDLAKAAQLYKEGKSYREIAKELGVNLSTISRRKDDIINYFDSKERKEIVQKASQEVKEHVIEQIDADQLAIETRDAIVRETTNQAKDHLELLDDHIQRLASSVDIEQMDNVDKSLHFMKSVELKNKFIATIAQLSKK